jgi:adenosylmethionine-8-amino-7-oxononanoate aminotransferase
VSNVRVLAQQHLFPHFTSGHTWYDQDLPVISRGDGCYLYDDQGRRYLDGLSGLFCVNIGYGRTDIAAAAGRQLEALAYWSNWSTAHPSSVAAAVAIAELAPGDLDVVFFVNSGSEAVESAIKFARQYHRSNGEPRRTKIIARDMAYHGTTLGALAVTGIARYKEPFGPLMPGTRHFPNTIGESTPQGGSAEDLPSLQALASILEEEGPETVAAIFAEPVQNSRGCLVPPDGYWPALRAICDRYGILLVADEVICGFGRLGEWFGSAKYGVVPDLITFAKGASSGYAPIGGVVIRQELAHQLLTSPETGMFTHGSTFGGHPLATAVAVANLVALREENVPGNVKALERHFQSGLDGLYSAHASVREWRGTGFFYAIELMGDRTSGRELTHNQAVHLKAEVMPHALREANLMTRPDDRGATMLILAPPLVADQETLDDLMHKVDSVLTATDKYLAE